MKKTQKEDSLRQFTIPNSFESSLKSFYDYLKNSYYSAYQKYVFKEELHTFDDMRDLFIHRCRAHMKYCDEIEHYGYLDPKALTSEELFFIKNVLKEKKVNSYEYSSKFLSKLTSLKNEIRDYVIGFILRFDEEQVEKREGTTLETHKLDFTLSNSISFYQHKASTSGKTIVVAKYFERIPELDLSTKKVKSWVYYTKVRFIDITNDGDKKSIDHVIYEFYNDCLSDPDKFKQPNKENRVYKNDRYYDYLTHEEAQQLEFYGEPIFRWAKKEEIKKRLDFTNDISVAQMNAGILGSLADFESASKLVQILEKIPDFKIKLTPEERKIIGQGGNVLALGRSGTGKTTCAILRLFSQDLLFKIRAKKSSIQMKLKDKRFDDEEDDLSMTGIHSIFVTASPVLCNEVSRYYKRLDGKVSDEMKRRKELAKQKSTSVSQEEAKFEKEKISEITTEKKSAEESSQEAKKENEENLEEIDEAEYLMDEEEAEAMSLMNKNVNLIKIEDKEFPLFLTVRRLVLMIDGTLSDPFFARDKNNDIISSNTRAQWHNEMKGAMLINNKFRGKQEEQNPAEKDGNPDEELVEAPENFGQDDVDDLTEEEIEAEYARYQAILAKKGMESGVSIKNKSKFEVDFDYFINHFWPSHNNRFKQQVSPLLVWSEFMSTIKGNANSYTYDDMHLRLEDYRHYGDQNLKLETREAIFETFLQYEHWKNQIGGYDFMDVVNHALKKVNTHGYQGAPIHFIMIDEVQDLSHATILLLLKCTEQGVFFAGDTAQTIAKGVGLKFSDLRSLFKDVDLAHPAGLAPSVHQLTVNFRSHGKILNIANSVISLVESFFPNTIDKLKKEKSEIDGPKPILLEGVDIEVLFAILFGTENYKSIRQTQSSGGLLDKPPIEFGCNQVIIVRDQESKEKLPTILKHALCLTVYEAKGLEFDQVILYNFFKDSTVSSEEWSLIEDALIQYEKVSKETYNQHFFTYKEDEDENSNLSDLEVKASKEGEIKQVNKNDMSFFESDYDSLTGLYIMKKLILGKKYYGRELSNYSMICNELKQLYVALTRPRNRIIIYDEETIKRSHIQKYWKELNVVQVITKSTLEAAENTENIGNVEVSSFKALIKSTGASEWKLQGLKMFRNKFYSQAYKCFQHSGDKDLADRCEAYMLAEQASDEMSKLSAQRSFIKEGVQLYANMSIRERNKHLKKLKALEAAQYEVFMRASDIFMKINLPKHAGRCAFSALQYEKAVKIFEDAGMLKEAGEGCVMQQDYQRAGDYFMRGKDYMRAIECYEKIHNYEKLLVAIDEYTDLPAKDKKILAQKYVPLALRALTEKVEFQDTKEEKDNDEVIKEDSEDEDDEDEVEIKKEKPLEESKREENPKDIDDISFDKISKGDISEKIGEITIPSTSNKPPQAEKDISEMSFVEVESKSETSSYVKIEEHLDNFDHLSDYDFKDEFLKVETGSVIESLASLRKKKSEISSDFSAVEFNQILNKDFHLVKTKTDIFIQDDVMGKIIKFVDRFRYEFLEDLNQIKGTRVLLSAQMPEINQLTENYIDFDNITKEFLFFILDFLERNNLHKLCIFVCNRYNLADKIGRYLCNLAFSYSPLITDGRKPTSQKLFNPRTSKMLQEKGFVANIAVHNILEIVNPTYISFKKKGEIANQNNSLDYTTLIKLISLGFWKKVLFIMDYENALALASTFASFDNYKMIYLTSIPENEEKIKSGEIDTLIKRNDFEFLPFKIPSNKEEIDLSILALESVIWGLNEKFPVCLHKDYNPESQRGESLSVPAFPSYLAYNGILWDFIINKKPEMKEKFTEYLMSACENLEKIMGSHEFKSEVIELRIYDIVSFLVQAQLFYESNYTISEVFKTLSSDKAIKVMIAYKSIFTFLENFSATNKYSEIILRAITSSFRVREIPPTSLLQKFGSFDSVVHKSSPIINELLLNQEETVMIDVEGHFIKTSRALCLKGIKNRLLIRLKMMIFFRVQGKVGTIYEQMGVSSFETVATYKKELEEKARLISLISMYDYCHSLLYGPRPVQKKIKKLPVKLEEEEIDEDEVYEDMEYEKKERSKKKKSGKESWSKDSKSGIHINFEMVQNSMLNNISSNPADFPFISFKYHLVKSFLASLNGYIGIRLSLDPYTLNYMTEIALNKLKTSIANKSLRPKIYNLFHLLGKDIILTERIRKLDDELGQDIQLYHDAIYYRLNGCSEEYAYNMVSFVRNAIPHLRADNMLFILENMTANLIVSRAVAMKSTKVYISRNLSKNIDMLKTTGENQRLLEKNIQGFTDRATFDDFVSSFYEYVDLIKKEDEGENQNIIYARILYMLINISVNDLGFTDASSMAIFENVRELSTIITSNGLKEFKKLSTPAALKKFSEEFAKKSDDDKKTYLKSSYVEDDFVEIMIKSNVKAAELNQEKSDKAYNLEMFKVAKRIILKKQLRKLHKKTRSNKVSARVLTDAYNTSLIPNICTYPILSTLKKAEFKKFYISTNIHLENFEKLNKKHQEISKFFSSNYKLNTFEYTYLLDLIINIAQFGRSYQEIIQEAFLDKIVAQKLHSEGLFSEIDKKLIAIQEEYNNWKYARTEEKKQAASSNKLKLTRLKWQEEAFMIRMQKIAKKRRAILKNYILEEKAMFKKS